jgi:predicted transcriptional regulator of viral defense system
MNIWDVGKALFTKEEALEDSGLSESAFYKASARLQEKSWLFQPRRGFSVIVRPEDRKMGAPPANEFIDYLMEYLDEPYYVGVLSAARIHGAAHQAPQAFQVVVGKTLQDIEKGRSPFEVFGEHARREHDRGRTWVIREPSDE